MTKIVYVVEDDAEVRSSLNFLLKAEGYETRLFEDGAHFIDSIDQDAPGVVLLDIRMPRCNGFQVLERLNELDIRWPVIGITGHGDVPIAVRLIKLGAIDLLEKPCSEEHILPVLERGFEKLEEDQEVLQWTAKARGLLAKLSRREFEVLQALASGRSNKEIADELHLSQRTVEMHRGNMMGKLEVGSLAEAVAIAVKLDVPLLPQKRFSALSKARTAAVGVVGGLALISGSEAMPGASFMFPPKKNDVIERSDLVF